MVRASLGHSTLLEHARRQRPAVSLDAGIELLLLQQRAQRLVVKSAVVDPPYLVQGHEPEALRTFEQTSRPGTLSYAMCQAVWLQMYQ